MLHFDAAIFDMDGVITRTALVHSVAWKKMFDEYLRHREEDFGEPFREFTHGQDYLAYVDGRPRYAGVEAFLKSRGISLPLGQPGDAGLGTICGLGNRKDALFNRVLDEEGVRVYDSTIALIKELLRRGVKTGVATSSKNGARVLEKAGISDLFAARVDGVVSQKLRLKGKPEPDIFIQACADLGASCGRAVVVEDAVSGVQAGAKGRFALVIGVARENNAAELKANGADVVVEDLAGLSADTISELVGAKDRKKGCPLPECTR